MKIALVIDTTLDSNDGVQQYVKSLGAWLSGQGHNVHYLTSQAKLKEWAGGPVHSLSRTIKVKFNGNRVVMPLPASRGRINGLLANENFDVFHVQTPYSPFLAQKIINQASEKSAVIGTFHIMPVGKIQFWGCRLLKVVYGRSLRRFDQFFSVSQPAKVFAARAFGINTDVSPNTLDLSPFYHFENKLKWPKAPGAQRIVFLGRLVERKGCQHLIKAFRLVHASMPHTELLIAGGGPMRQKLESEVAKMGLSENVKFLGFIDEADKAPLLASADIACYPSTGGESFGIVLIEAMAAGSRIVLGGNNPGYASVLGDRPELLFDPLDTLKFAEKIKYFLADSPEHQEVTRWLKEAVKQYDVPVVGQQIEQAYLSSVAKRR